MATLDVIRNLTLRAKAEGFLDAQKQVRDLGDTYDSSAKKTLSVDKSLQQLQRRYDQEFRAQQDLAKVAKTLDQARNQGLITQERQIALMQNAIRYHNSSAQSAGLHAAALNELAAQATSAASGFGTLGAVLSRLGPAGIAFAAALATITAGMVAAGEASLKLAEQAGKIRDLSETTGFTTTQLQGLTRVAAQVGVDSATLGTGLERFAASMDEVQARTGKAFEALSQIDPQIARDISNAKNMADAWDLVAKALQNADVQQRNVAARALFGRGGTGLTRALGATGEAGGLNTMIAAQREADNLTQEQIKHWDDLGDTINENLRQIQQNIVSIFAGQFLTNMANTTTSLRHFSETLQDVARGAQTTPWDSIWDKMFSNLSSSIAKVMPGLTIIAGIFTLIRGKAIESQQAVGNALGPPRTMQEAEQGFKDLQTEVNAWRDAVIKAANDNQRLNEALGSTVTPAEQLAQKLLLVQKMQAEGKITADQSAEAQRRLQKEFRDDSAKRNAAALSGVATETEKLTEKIRDLQVQASKGEISFSTMQRAVEGLKDEAVVAELERQVQALGDAATEAEKYAAASARLAIQVDKGEVSQETANRKLLEMTPILKDLHSQIGNFFDTFVQGMLDGKSATESLAASLKQLGQSITSSAFKDLGANISKSISSAAGSSLSDMIGGTLGQAAGGIGGPLAAAAVGVGVSLLGKLFDNSEANKAAQEAAAAQQKAAEAASQAAQALGQATDAMKQLVETTKGPFQQSLEQGEKTLDDTIDKAKASQQAALALAAAWNYGGAGAAAAAQTFADANRRIDEARQIFQEFADGLKTDFIDKLTQQLREAQGVGFLNQFSELIDQMRQARSDANVLGVEAGDLIDQVFRASAQKLVNDLQLVGGQFNLLLQTFPELTGVVTEFSAAATATKRSVDELNKSAQDLQARLFAATNDPSTLAGALAAFDFSAQQQREEEAKAGGENMVLLETTLAAERLRIIQDFNDKAVQAEKDAAQARLDQINSVAKNIVTYINSLLAGPQSALSPANRLAAAQAAFQSQLTLAQSGNIEAQQGITQFAEDFRQAAKDMFGSSQQFQDIQQQIITALGALPAVQQASDATVQALAQVVGAVNATTAAVNTTTGAVSDGTTTLSSDLTTQASLLTSANQISNSANLLAVDANSLAATANAFLQSVQSLLSSINTQTAVLLSSEDHLNNIQNTSNSINTRASEISSHTSHMYAPGGSLQFFLARGGVVPDASSYGSNVIPLRRAFGGPIGPAMSDTVAAWLTPGEFVVKRSVATANLSNLEALNATGAWPSSENMQGEIRRLGLMLSGLLRQIADLQAAGNRAIADNTQATHTQTQSLNRETRFAARKGAA